MGKKSRYQSYLKSSHWHSLRSIVLERDGYACTRCGSGRRLHVHHLRYRKSFEETRTADLTTLCQKCHERLHQERARLRRLNRKSKLVRLILDFGASALVFSGCTLSDPPPSKGLFAPQRVSPVQGFDLPPFIYPPRSLETNVGWVLQRSTDLTNWIDVAYFGAGTNGGKWTVPKTNGPIFYRMISSKRLGP